MDLIKKQKFGFFANIIVAIMTFVTLVIYILNVTSAYYQDMNTKVAVMMVGALVFIVGAIVIPQITQGMLAMVAVDAFRVATAVLIIVSGVTFIGMRVESFGYIFGSNLELGNEAAFSAGTQAIIEIILFVVTWFLSLIASFFEIGKKKA